MPDARKDDAEFGLLIPFPDSSESFTLGFEAGMIWQQMEHGAAEIRFTDAPLHDANREVFQRMAAARGYDLSIITSADGWISGEFTKRRRSLSVIDGGANA